MTGVTGVSGEVRSKSKQYGVFIQDDWQVNDHLQLNIGLRWDYEKTPSYLDFVTPQQVVDAIYSQDPRAPPARPMPIRWHWAGHQRLHQQRPQPQGIQGCLAPRLGFV